MMSSKAVIKKKDGTKNLHLSKSDIDDEIKAELDAMSGLEYNLHCDNDNEIDATASSVRKSSRTQSIKESNRVNDKITMENDKFAINKDKNDVESSTIPYLSSSVTRNELRKIIKQIGNTSEDRYKILEARDRLMRLRHGKNHILHTAKATVGTCPDMCPEKERLMREFQRQVASYELLDSTEYKINNDIAVKQYSRSSADQEEPMPQDLRPVSSLKMTMSYLLHEIANLCDEEGTNLAEWYHFLWDRTRGIRKDITQQELCCIDTVELVENCARFHIVCSERLCSEELSVFDKKINTENLTKCLQTLKYMYHDLRIEGIQCKNEAEFRAYIILLNLNDANFMWDLQRLPTCIQKSSHVNFAIRVYSAIQSNNYTKFFKLVKDTTYWNACILLRYFFQVRVQALSVMVKAYCRTTSTAYPLYEFIDILAFDDESEAINFCEQAGLSLSNDELHIVLNRQNIILPSPTTEQCRAKSVVEAKRIKMGYSIGQAIAGGKMPEQFYINHKPHNSFDTRGYLKPESINASDQSGNNGDIIEIDAEQDEQDVYEYMDEDVPDKPPPPYIPTEMRHKKSSTASILSADSNKNKVNRDVPKKILTDETDVKFSFASNIDNLKTTDLKTLAEINNKKISKEDNKRWNVINSSSNEKSILFGDQSHKTNNIFASSKTSVTVDIFKTTSSQVNTTSKCHSDIFSQSAIKSTIFSTPITSITPFCQSEKEEIATNRILKNESIVEPIKKVEDNREKYIVEKSALKIANEIEIQVINDICSTVMKQEIKNNATYDRLSNDIFNNILNEINEEICQNIVEDELLTQKKLRDISNRIKNKIITKYYIIWCQRVFMKKQQRSALDNTPVWLPKCSLTECANSLYNKEQNLVIQNMRCKRKINNDCDDDNRKYLVPIEVQIYNGIKKNAKRLDIELSSIMYWKLIISWPNLNEKFLLGRYKRIMCEYFCPRDFAMDPLIKVYKPNSHETLNICIKHTNDTIDKIQSAGADGLLFITVNDESLKMSIERLKRTIISRNKLMRMPVVLIIFGNDNHNVKLILTREIEILIESGYISQYIIYCENKIDESIILKLTQNAIDWLTHRKSSAVPLEMNSLSELINSCLTDELWLRISGHASYNVNLSTALGNPQFIINIYNEAVTHLIDIVHDPESLMYTNFPLEFKQFLSEKFKLPCTYEYFDESWKTADNRQIIEQIVQSFTLQPWPFNWPIEDSIELEKCIIRYCDSTLTNNKNYSRILCNILSDVFYVSDEKETPNFIHIILEISKERLRNIDNNVCVVYNKTHIKHFQTLPWWFESNTLINFNSNNAILTMQHYNNQLNGEPVEKKRRIQQNNDELPCIIDKYNNYFDDNSIENSFIEQSHIDDVFNISQQFEKTLSKQLLSNNDFEKKLNSALREADMDI